MSQQPRARFNFPMLFTVNALVVLLVVGGYVFLQRANERGWLSKGISNCRQVTMALLLYAGDHDGRMPDATLTQPTSSNEVFRALFTDRYVESELIFTCPYSPFHPDGDFGSEPAHARALEAGENHWAMTAGITKDSPDSVPLVYESPEIASWPPQWNYAAWGTETKGRTWSMGVVVSRNDGSASIEKIDAFWWSRTVGLARNRDGKDPFEAAIDPVKFPKGVVLDVLQKGK